jgi:hypothetical protein
MMMKAAGSSEKLIYVYQPARRQIPEDRFFLKLDCNFKEYNVLDL